MKTTISCNASTISLTVCTICHVWNVIQLLRVLTSEERALNVVGLSVGLMLVYMVAVCVFNWCALTSGSSAYRRVAVSATAVHLVCALIQGAAAHAMVQGAWDWLRYGIAIPALLNLPMGGMQVLSQAESLFPWGTAMFFALNLLIVVLRLQKTPECV